MAAVWTAGQQVATFQKNLTHEGPRVGPCRSSRLGSLTGNSSRLNRGERQGATSGSAGGRGAAATPLQPSSPSPSFQASALPRVAPVPAVGPGLPLLLACVSPPPPQSPCQLEGGAREELVAEARVLPPGSPRESTRTCCLLTPPRTRVTLCRVAPGGTPPRHAPPAFTLELPSVLTASALCGMSRPCHT